MLAVDCVQTKLLEPPYGSCRSGDDGYRQSVCVMSCETQFLVSRCHCRYSYMPGTCFTGVITEFVTKLGFL